MSNNMEQLGQLLAEISSSTRTGLEMMDMSDASVELAKHILNNIKADIRHALDVFASLTEAKADE